MGNTSGQAVSGTTQNIEYAGFWVRVAAYFVDFAIVTGICLVIAVGASFVGAVWIAMLVLPLIQFLYWPVMESSARQATFGKSLCGIKVTDLEGRHLSFKSALLRNIAKILSAIPFCIGFLLAAFTARKQALHDMLAKTLVVRTGPSHLFKVIAMAVGGFVIVVAGSGAYLYYVYLPQMKNDVAGMMQESAKNASTAHSVSAMPPSVDKKAAQPTPAVPVVPKGGAGSGTPLPATGGAKPSVLAFPVAASAADKPEAIYAKFHSAGLTANFDEMLKYGTAQPDLISMPAAERQAMLDFLAQMLPKTYTVMRKMVDPDGNHATLHLDASGVVGTITLVKENGMWKVGNADWGGSPKTSELPSNMKAATVTGTKVKPPPVKETKGQLSTAASEEPPVAPERTYQVSPENVITPKFN